MNETQGAQAQTTTQLAAISGVTDEGLIEALRQRGYVVSVWSVADLDFLGKQPWWNEPLSGKQLAALKETAIQRVSPSLQDTLGLAGHDYLVDWCFNNRSTLLATAPAEATDDGPAAGNDEGGEPDSPFRVLCAHPNRNLFEMVVEAKDGLRAFGQAALLLKEAGEENDAVELYAAIPAETAYDLPGDSVVLVETVLDPEQAEVFGLTDDEARAGR